MRPNSAEPLPPCGDGYWPHLKKGRKQSGSGRGKNGHPIRSVRDNIDGEKVFEKQQGGVNIRDLEYPGHGKVGNAVIAGDISPAVSAQFLQQDIQPHGVTDNDPPNPIILPKGSRGGTADLVLP